MFLVPLCCLFFRYVLSHVTFVFFAIQPGLGAFLVIIGFLYPVASMVRYENKFAARLAIRLVVPTQ